MLLINSSLVNSFCLISYNSRGFCKLKQDFCRYIISKEVVGSSLPIICNQENFLLKSNSYKINNSLPGFHVVSKPAEISSFERGRPRGGLFIALPNILRSCVVDVSPSHWRVQAILINFNGSKILLINSYFPVDTKLNNYDDSDLVETLQCIRMLLDNTEHEAVIWAGDINADFERNTKHVDITKSFIDERNLNFAWNYYDIDFTHYHEMNNTSYVSVIDHIIWDSNFKELVSDCGVIHHPNNLSDHSPVFCQFRVKFSSEDKASINAKPSLKPSWCQSSETEKVNYKTKQIPF